MIKSKLLTDSAWKDVLAKNKTVKDNGLLKALADAKKLGDDDHDAASAVLDQIVKLTGQLKKSKEVAAIPAVGKFLAEMAGAAEAAGRDVAKAKAEHEKAQKAKAEAEKKAHAAAARKDDDEDDDEEEATPDLLTTKMVPLLRRVAKGETMHTLVAKAGKQVVVLLSPKPISPSRRKMLAEQLGGSGVKYYPGHCALEEGKPTFVLKAEVSGMAKLIKAALLEQTGLRLNKTKCRGEDGEDEDLDDIPVGPGGEAPPENRDDGGGSREGMVRPMEIGAPVGRGGKNLEDDVRQVQAALNRRMGIKLDVDGRCGPATIAAIVEFQRALGQSRPDGRVDPGRGTARALAASGKLPPPPPPPKPIAPPEDLGPPTLVRAPLVWNGTRHILDHNIAELKRAIRQEYANEEPALLAEIDQHVKRVDVILEKLDTRLAQTLERAGAAKADADRKAEIQAAKKILAEYIAFVKSEPLIDHVDRNPFGVDTKVRKVITDSLTHMVRSIS
jgi:hypothetical protein